MRKRTAKLFVMLAVLSSFGAVGGVAQARHGADDVNHHRTEHRRAADDRNHHRRAAHHRHHHRHGADDVKDDVSHVDGAGHR